MQQKINQYALPVRSPGAQQVQSLRANSMPPLKGMAAPPIPDPDYSLSESDGEDEKSLILAHNTKMNEHITLPPLESSGNSNTR